MTSAHIRVNAVGLARQNRQRHCCTHKYTSESIVIVIKRIAIVHKVRIVSNNSVVNYWVDWMTRNASQFHFVFSRIGFLLLSLHAGIFSICRFWLFPVALNSFIKSLQTTIMFTHIKPSKAYTIRSANACGKLKINKWSKAKYECKSGWPSETAWARVFVCSKKQLATFYSAVFSSSPTSSDNQK